MTLDGSNFFYLAGIRGSAIGRSRSAPLPVAANSGRVALLGSAWSDDPASEIMSWLDATMPDDALLVALLERSGRDVTQCLQVERVLSIVPL